jgi:hypothetical protein
VIPIPVNLVLNLFADALAAFDVVHTRDARGLATPTQEADRSISGIIQPITDETVSLIPEGAQRDGAKLVHTRAPVSAATNVNGGSSGRQTYVRHEGGLWKLWTVNGWGPHTDIGYYVITRYIDTNGVIT